MSSLAEHESCHRCGAENVTWFAPSPLWNLVMRGNDINGDALHDDLVCMPCFVILADLVGVEGVWRLSVDPEPDGLVKVTPSGRVWDDATNRWRDPSERITSRRDGHWLVFDADRRITGCHCGFEADLDSDCGWGDSVVDHIYDAGRADYEAADSTEPVSNPHRVAPPIPNTQEQNIAFRKAWDARVEAGRQRARQAEADGETP